MNNQPASSATNAPPGNTGKPVPPPDHPAGEEHHWGTWILIAVVIVMGFVAFRLFHGAKPPPRETPAVSVTITNVWQGDIDITESAIATVQSVYTVAVSPRVDGQINSVNFTEGQNVNTNDLLAVIDPRPYQAALLEAQGQLERDKALLEGATVDLNRYSNALSAISKQQYDDQLALVHQDEGTVLFDQGQVSNAQVQVDYCYIRSPIAGRVGLRLIDPGNVVHGANSNAMCMIAQIKPITVVFNVSEDHLPQIEKQWQAGHDMVVEAYDRAEENKLATGKFLTLDSQIDSTTGTIRIRSLFPNDDESLFPNQFVNAKLIIDTIHDATIIPTYAIQHNPEGAFVYVLTNAPDSTNKTVVMRNITLGTSDNDVTAITEGLEPGDVIALDNFNKLGEGVKVNPRQSGMENPSSGGSGGHHHKHSADGSTNNPREKDGS